MPDDTGGTKRAKKRSRAYRLARIPIFVALFVILVVMGAWVLRATIVEQAVRHTLARAGFEVTRLEIAQLDPQVARLSGFRATLKSDATQYIDVQSLVLDYQLGFGRVFVLKAVAVTGVDIRLALESLTSLPYFDGGGQIDPGSAPIPSLSDFFDKARIEDGKMAIVTPYGIAHAAFSGSYETRSWGKFSFVMREQAIAGDQGTAQIERFFVEAQFSDHDPTILMAGMAGTATGELGAIQHLEWLAELSGPALQDLRTGEGVRLEGDVNVSAQGLEIGALASMPAGLIGREYQPILEALADGVDIGGRYHLVFAADNGLIIGAPGEALEVSFGEGGFLSLEPEAGALMDPGRVPWPLQAVIRLGGEVAGGAVPVVAAQIRALNTPDGVELSLAAQARDLHVGCVSINEPARLAAEASLSDTGEIAGRFDFDSLISCRQDAFYAESAVELTGELSGGPAGYVLSTALDGEDSCLDIGQLSYQSSVTILSKDAKLCQKAGPLSLHWRGGTGSREIEIDGGYQIENLELRFSSDDYSGRALIPVTGFDIAFTHGGGGLSYHLDDIDIAIDDLINVSDVSISGAISSHEGNPDADGLQGEAPQITAQFSEAVLSDPRTPRLLAPIKLQPKISIGSEQILVQGEISTLDDISLGDGELRLNRADLSGEGEFNLADIAFYEQGVQPQRLILPLRSVATDVIGAANGAVEVTFEKGALVRSRAEFNLVDLAFSGPTGPVAGVNTKMRLSSLVPVETDGPQKMTIGVMTLGVNFLDGEIEYQILPSGNLQIGKAEWPFAGGKMGLYDTKIPKDLKSFESMVEIRNLDIGQLFNIADITGFDGSGRLNGSLPMTLKDDGRGPVIKGWLETDGPGRLEYIRPQSPGAEDVTASASTGVPGGAGLLFKALENFEYDTLVLDLDGPIQGKMDISMKALGRNPEVLNGKSIELNVTTNVILSDLIAAAQYQTYLKRLAKIPGADLLTD